VYGCIGAVFHIQKLGQRDLLAGGGSTQFFSHIHNEKVWLEA
jgi:hypothetical protein